MALEPKVWRERAGLTLRDLAVKAGIRGKNPARTYDRYERGEQDCPPAVMEAVRIQSGGAVGAEQWLKVRLRRLRRRQRSLGDPARASA
jgi:transcriptional regulator with XRE-family HTH domain